MMYDIAALQHMYGADFTTNAGNTVYTLEPDERRHARQRRRRRSSRARNRIFATIWDGGGTDTYDLSAYATEPARRPHPGRLFDLLDGAARLPRRRAERRPPRQHLQRAAVPRRRPLADRERHRRHRATTPIAGNAAANNLQGGAGNDSLSGSAGADVLEGGGGVDREAGGDGNDRFVLRVGFEVGNVWDGGAGTDTFDFRAIGAGFSGISINLVSGYTDGAGTSSLLGIENVWGSDSSEWVSGSAAANQLLGYGGNDTMAGLGGNDTVDGGAGSDSLGGGAGNDRMLGGVGNDSLFGVNGNDTLLGGTGNNSLNSGAGADSLAGEAGNDVLGSGDGKDTLVGGSGQDRFDFNLVSNPRSARPATSCRRGAGARPSTGRGAPGPAASASTSPTSTPARWPSAAPPRATSGA